MSSKEEIAQSVGNANVRGKFDTDVATAVGPNTNDAVLFPRLRSDHDGNMTGIPCRNGFGKAVQNLRNNRRALL